MIDVFDNDNKFDLGVLIKKVGDFDSCCVWEVFNLEYSGSDFDDELPELIEMKSKNGIRLNCRDFDCFVRSVNQVIEGVFILREKYDDCVSMDEKGSLIKIIISDGSFWEVGGDRAEKFIDAAGLIRVQ